MKLNFFSASLCFFLPALYASAAAAVDSTAVETTLGIAGQEAAKYSGSSDYSFNVLPYIKLQYGNYYLDSERGLGFETELGNGFYVSQALGYTTGRKDRDSDWRQGSDRLKGMGSIKSAVNSSTTLGWQVADWVAIEGNLTAPLTDSQGMQYAAALKFSIIDTATDTLGIATTANFGDSRYNNLFYGVSAKQSQRSRFNAFHASSGLYSYEADISWLHYFDNHWSGYADFKYTRFAESIRKSPVVTSNNNTELTLGLLYTFK